MLSPHLQPEQGSVQGWLSGRSLLESYRYAPGRVEAPRPHVHAEFQIGLSLDSHGEYRIRGQRFPVEVGTLSVIPPDQVHQSRDADALPATATYRMLYVGSRQLEEAVGTEPGSPASTPTFSELAVSDTDLVGRFLRFWASSRRAPGLEADGLLLATLSALVGRHARAAPALRPARNEHRAVALARDFLHAHPYETVALSDLARVSCLSPFHLTRVFAQGTGLPPHAYQIALRVERARRLLLEGKGVARVAGEVGFHDASHFTRHFARLVGTPPGRYAANRKNVHARWHPQRLE